MQLQHPELTASEDSFTHLALGLGRLKQLRLLGHLFLSVRLVLQRSSVRVGELLSRQFWTSEACVPGERARWNLHCVF